MNIKQTINETKQFVRRLLPLGSLPQHVFIVGAQKAGTTALHSYLAQHPMIIGGDCKELGFFSREMLFNSGLHCYRSMFPISIRGTHALDATPEYMYYSKSAGRMHDYKPDAKIIMLLREPVSRAYSAFNMYQQCAQQEWFRKRIQYANADARAFFNPLVEGKVKPEIGYFLDSELKIIRGEAEGEEPGLIRRGIYAPQLERFISLFGRENVLVAFSDELRREPENFVAKVFDFIEIEPIRNLQYPSKNVRKYSSDSAAVKEIVRCVGNLYEEDKNELKEKYDIVVPW